MITVAAALAMGLFGSAHCAAMCGSASSVLCGASAEGPSRQRLVAFNVGRLLGYAVLGALANAVTMVGSQASLGFVRFGVRVLSVLAVLSVGLKLLDMPSLLDPLERAGAFVWRPASRLVARLLPLRTTWQAALVGAVWGLMPCGLLYAALAMASTAPSPAQAALTMLAFGMGTGPVMLLIGRLAVAFARLEARRWLRRGAGMSVLAFGLWTALPLAREVQTGHVGGTPSCCPTAPHALAAVERTILRSTARR